MIKKFSSPKIKIWFELMFLTGSFAVLSGAVPPPFRIFTGGFFRRNAFELIQEYCTIEEIASFEGSPRFLPAGRHGARRVIRIGLSGQKRIGDFLKHGSSRLFSEMLSFLLCFRSQPNSRLDSTIKRTHEPVRAKTDLSVQNL